MSDFDIRDFDFTDAAWESLYSAVDDTVFLDQDAQRVYDSLKHRLRFISFGDYLKRYIYQKAELTEPFAEVPLSVYQSIIKSAFAEYYTPSSFTPTTVKLSALSKNWLTQHTVKRRVVFLLGFGLRMSVEDVNLFLTKALREPAINPKNPFEVICWYCYKNGYSFKKYEQLWEQYINTPAKVTDTAKLYGEHTVGVRNSMYGVHDDRSLMALLAGLKTEDNAASMSVTAKEWFDRLFDEARDVIADMYNQTEYERHADAVAAYQDRLHRNDRMYDYEKHERLRAFRDQQRRFTRNDITESDIEHIICASIPTDRHGNLTPSKASKLNAQFDGKRFSRQRIGDIRSGKSEINRFDLITLQFFVFSQKLAEYPTVAKRYSAFLDTVNTMLEECSMGTLYVQNPYECFVLMCMLSMDPLGTYADVWELSYEIITTGRAGGLHCPLRA